ncbi:hypothetical protein PUN28_019698 [Cardiocondyla obscurior]|uniref:Uncharacterized protein n=1 Tax=Cardiocondyla obscurior TaxID=286306 RepID=A0AAW2EA39_9HYME
MARSDNNKTNEQNESLDDILNDENFIFSSFGKMDFEDVQAGPSRQPPPRDDVAVAQRQSSPRREEPIASTEANNEDRAGATAHPDAETLARENENLRKRLEILEQKLNRRKYIWHELLAGKGLAVHICGFAVAGEVAVTDEVGKEVGATQIA